MKVTVNNKEYEISKIPLGKYAQLLSKVKGLPKKLVSVEGLTNDTFFEMLPSLIEDYLPEFIAMISVATPIPETEAENMGLDELVDVVVAVIEVNKFIDTFQKIKKVTSRPASQ